MNYLKNFGISFLYSIISLLFLVFLLTFLNYINFIDGGFFIFFMIFDLVFSVLLGSIMLSKGCSDKGWFEGLKFGFVFLLFISLLDYFGFSFSFNFKFLFFSIIILISSVLGGMIGINFKKEKK